jgi:hypothetical protein
LIWEEAMKLGSLTKLGILAAVGLAGAGLAAGSGVGQAAAPLNPAFGPIKFHQAATSRRIVVSGQQIRENPGEPFAAWVGYSTFPDFTPAQRRMISDNLQAAKGGGGGSAKGGKPGPSPSPSPTPTPGTGTIPYWQSDNSKWSGSSPTYNGTTYTVSMVGPNPYDSSTWNSANNTVTYVPIILKVTIGKHTYDPSTQKACGDSQTVANRFFSSPLFNSANYSSNGTPVSGQLTTAFQRANFYSKVSGTGGSNFGITLTSLANPITVAVSFSGRTYTVSCGSGSSTLGSVDINTFDSAIQSIIAQYAPDPKMLPVILTYNVVQSQYGQCCILGYHNAVALSSGGVETYATGTYVDPGVFSGISDISIWSHEIGEWLDDPFVQANVPGGGSADLTPGWGGGQVSGCQNNLETGDPLTGTLFNISYTDPLGTGFQFHTQDLAFKDWFYRSGTSDGTGGKYSFLGTFQGPYSGSC